MPARPPSSPAIVEHVRPIFHDAAFVHHLGIVLDDAGEGWCETSLVLKPEHRQQHGHVHAGVVATLADHTAGGAARAAVKPGTDVITIEFKINFLRPARGARLRAVGHVLRAGRTIIVAESEVLLADEADGPVVAKCVETLAVIPQGPGPG